ncbi:MAG: PqqD family peptide modification chaperone [Peptococcaceae bacterium]|nr:PqqD family peptide modification chaperone [Peptococcaceae bacterium]
MTSIQQREEVFGKTLYAYGQPFFLNHTGKLIWDYYQAGQRPHEIIEGICSKFGVPVAEATDDVVTFMAHLARHRLVTYSPDTSLPKHGEGGQGIRALRRDIKSPLVVQWELTHSCTNRCIFCHNPAYEPLTISDEHAKIVLEALISAGVFHITFTGGEPTLHPLLPELISIATKAGVPTSIITNGNHIAADGLTEMKKCGLSGVQVSLHSHDPQVHASLTENTVSYKEALSFIDRALALGLNPNVNTVITSLNPHLNDVYRFVSSLGVRSYTLTRYIPTRPDLGYLERPFEQVKKELCDMVLTQIARVPIKLLTPFPLCALTQSEMAVLRPIMAGCDGGDSWATISPSGYFKPCPTWDLNCGSIIQSELEPIWKTNANLQAIRTGAFIPQECKICDLRSTCSTGCRGCALAASGSPSSFDPLVDLERVRELRKCAE